MRRLLPALALGAALLGSDPAEARPGATEPTAEDIRDIRGLMEIPDPWRWVPFALAGSLGAVAVALTARRFARRGSKPRSPAEIALERLDEAEARISEIPPDAFSEAVSAALRDYVEARFEVRAGTRTTDEFLRELTEREASPLGPHAPELAAFLEACDLAKFARSRLSLEEMRGMARSGRTFVAETAKAEAREKAEKST